MNMKRMLSLLLALALCLAPSSAYAAGGSQSSYYQLGDQMEDFSFTAFDGVEYTLSQVLEEKDLVLINIWATWCGPCQREFPYMEEAYEQYQDSVEIFALSLEPTDTDDVLADYVANMGMTFPVGQDTPGLADRFLVSGIPTSIVVDRFGTICLIETGSQPAVSSFTNLFDAFLGEDYTQSTPLNGIPAALPSVTPADEKELADALTDGELTVRNPNNRFNWPVTIVSDDERTYVTTSNTGIDNSVSAIEILVDAAEGDVLALDYKISSEAVYDCMIISLDGETVKHYGGERDWAPHAFVIEEAGQHTVTLAFEKDEMQGDGDDAVCFDNVRLLSGEEAEAALASLPVYPHAEQTTLTVANESAREIAFDDPDGILADYFGAPQCFIVPDDEVIFTATLAEGVDPDGATGYSYYDNTTVVLSSCVDGDVYTFTGGIDSIETTGYSYTYEILSEGLNAVPVYVFFFASEENVNTFLAEELGGSGSWRYVDGAAPGSDTLAFAVSDVPDGHSAYKLVFVDQASKPVEGVIANVCDDSSCTPMVSDADGVIEFTYPSFAYHIDVIRVPDGYEYEAPEEDEYLDEAGGLVLFTLTKK